tara:strand:+ start:437 stop:658 length:222 start_codon:yes stop_codon:yes gene_type:complete
MAKKAKKKTEKKTTKKAASKASMARAGGAKPGRRSVAQDRSATDTRAGRRGSKAGSGSTRSFARGQGMRNRGR